MGRWGIIIGQYTQTRALYPLPQNWFHKPVCPVILIQCPTVKSIPYPFFFTRGHFVTFHMKYALVYPDALHYLYEHNGKPWHKSSLEITDSAISSSSIFFYFSSIFCIKSINCFLFSVADNPLHFNNRVSVRDSMCSLSS